MRKENWKVIVADENPGLEALLSFMNIKFSVGLPNSAERRIKSNRRLSANAIVATLPGANPKIFYPLSDNNLDLLPEWLTQFGDRIVLKSSGVIFAHRLQLYVNDFADLSDVEIYEYLKKMGVKFSVIDTRSKVLTLREELLRTGKMYSSTLPVLLDSQTGEYLIFPAKDNFIEWLKTKGG